MAKKKTADVSEMRYNPLVAGGRFTDHYKELTYYKEFKASTDLEDKLVRLAFMVTQKNSPVEQIADYEIKIKESASLIGIKDEQTIEQILKSENTFFRKAITRCCIFDNKYAYERWLSMITAYNEFNYMIRLPIINAKDPLKALELKQKIGLKMEEWMKDILRAERQLFQDDYTKESVYLESAQREIHYAEEFADIPETII